MDQRRDLLGYMLPKTVVGLALWLLIFALGVGASGVVFFVAYERRLTEMESRMSSVRTELERKLNDAVTRLENADRANQGSVRGTVHLGGADRTGTVYTWDATHDLALLVVNVGSVPSLKLSDAVPAPGLSVWAVGAASGQFGATAAKGQLLGSSALSLTTDAVFGGTASGGPLVDREGKVMGVLGTFQATGTPISPAGQAVPVRLACLQVVVCPR